MRLEDVTVEDVRIHGEGQNELIRLKPVVNQYMRNKVPGHIANLTFKNLTLEGPPAAYRVQLSGADETHQVENVTLDNVVIAGEKLAAKSRHLEVGSQVTGVRFQEGSKR